MVRLLLPHCVYICGVTERREGGGGGGGGGGGEGDRVKEGMIRVTDLSPCLISLLFLPSYAAHAEFLLLAATLTYNIIIVSSMYVCMYMAYSNLNT